MAAMQTNWLFSRLSALALVAVAAACGDSPAGSIPTVLATTPLAAATAVATNARISATFSEAMDPASLTSSTFTLRAAPGNDVVGGTVVYANKTATFWPAAQLAANTTYTATITPQVKSATGVALAAAHPWSFTSGTTKAAGVPVALGTAGNYVILAKSGISTVPTSAITGNIAVSPAAASAITGFSLTRDSANTFATSTQITGKVYAADYAVPTPADLTAAISDMELAARDAAGRAPDVTELGAGTLTGQTLVPGVYRWSSGLLIPTDLTLSGSATDVWIFQVAQDLTFSSGAQVMLAGGALPRNIFWQVAGQASLGSTAHLEGVLLTSTAAVLHTGATVRGRLLAQTAVTLDGSTVVEPQP
jgi:hypothetical protein